MKELLGIGFLITVLLFVGNLDRKDAEKDESIYCEMVAVWQNDPRPEIDRAGWPPYDPNIQCEK